MKLVLAAYDEKTAELGKLSWSKAFQAESVQKQLDVLHDLRSVVLELYAAKLAQWNKELKA